ncbi:MAG: carboxylating nicotinate-nucleotide diphosphorylase [Salibacteraceae bacterium]
MEFELNEFLRTAFGEDLGSGDHTTLACVDENNTGRAVMETREKGVAAGIEVAVAAFRFIDCNLAIEPLKTDGEWMEKGDRLMVVSGKSRSILAAERTVLNIVQRMCGIATTTKRYADAVKHTRARVLDTRKTTPGLRYLEKMAVRMGGGTNHRFGLFDMILIKDNHIDAAGGVKQALSQTREYLKRTGLNLKVEIEVRDFDELNQVMDVGGADRIMLDNFSVADTQKAVNLIDNRFEIESSGGITLETIAAYAETGVDFISVGALTHSVKALDISLIWEDR